MTATATATQIVEQLQSPENLDNIKVWEQMMEGARAYVKSAGFTTVHNMPHIVGVTGACENVDTLFKTDFFGKQAYLAQSDQLYLELLTQKLGKVSCEIQSFRAEPKVDNRRLCQFTLFEIEHLGDLAELQRHISGILAAAIDYALIHDDILSSRGRDTNKLRVVRDYVWEHGVLDSLTYEEAVSFLQAGDNFPDVQFGDDLGAAHEAEIVNHFGPVFVTHYPEEIKFFNMRGNDEDPRVVNSCDLLLPFAGESAGAAERETDYAKVEEKLKKSSMYKQLIDLGGSDEDFEWYLSAHRDRDVQPHAGAGIGMARVAQFLLGEDDIRHAVPFTINAANLL